MSHKKRAVARVGLFVALTLLTQIGGFCYLLGLAVGRRRRVGLLAAIASYVVLTALVVPPLAQRFGRVRLPCFANGSSDVVAATSLTCVLNRGYVRPQVYALITTLGSEVRRRFPGSQVTTLEAGFPFLDTFPLLPHLSHGDGRKVDVAYFYRNAADGAAIAHGSPSWLGYFIYVKAKPEDDGGCSGQNTLLRWDLHWLQPVRPVWTIDEQRTGWLLAWLRDHSTVIRIFVEPHVAKRLGVTGGKIRFQGCHAARHDDHIHIEVQ